MACLGCLQDALWQAVYLGLPEEAHTRRHTRCMSCVSALDGALRVWLFLAALACSSVLAR